MLIEIKKIPNGERVFETDAEIEGKKIPIKLKTKRDFADISCSVEYETEVECECSRCLEKFQQKIAGDVRFFIVPESKKEFACEDFDCYYYKSENDKIDFEQTIFDDMFTQIPMKPLCKGNCVGIIWEENKKNPENSEEEENGQWKAALEKLRK